MTALLANIASWTKGASDKRRKWRDTYAIERRPNRLRRDIDLERL